MSDPHSEDADETQIHVERHLVIHAVDVNGNAVDATLGWAESFRLAEELAGVHGYYLEERP